MRNYLLVIVLLALGLKLQSQGNSLYSQLGVGNYYPSTFNSNFSQGGLSSTVSSKNFINPNNPASFSKIKYTVGEFGVFNSNNFYTQNDSSAEKSAVSLGNFGFAFPLSSNAGFALGFMPYSKINYNYSLHDISYDNIPIVRKYEGVGNVSCIFFGSGISIKNLSIGVNAQYLFGELTKVEHIQFPSNDLLNIRNQKITLVRGLTSTFGVQYSLPINEEHLLLFGATYSLGNTIGADYYQKVNNYVIQQATIDNKTVNVERHDVGTVLEDSKKTPTSGTLSLPQNYKGGFVFSKKGRYSIGLDYHNSAWDAFRLNGDSFSFKRSQKIILGVEILPNEQAKGFENYLKSLIYRGGINYGNSPIFINGEQLVEYGINFGFGFPLVKTKYESEKFGSYLFLSFGYDRVAGKKANTINEDYYKINLSVILNDKWFIKRKFD